MNERIREALVIALVAGGLAACDAGPTAPGGGGVATSDGSSEVGVSAELELQVASDPVLSEIAVEEISLFGDTPSDGAGSLFAEVRECFRGARELIARGEAEAAMDTAVDCRRLLVEALIAEHGEAAIDALFGRVERLLERLADAGDEFARLEDLEARVAGLLDEASALREEGDLVAAGERLVLALQIADRMRHRHREFIRDPDGHARLAVARSGEAIRLARRLIDEPTRRQGAVLSEATELHRRARVALQEGAYRRAVVLARHAEGRSLFAVLECERPTVQDALELLAVAEEMIRVAGEAIGSDPSPAQQRILARAIHLKELGAAAIDHWRWRGVAVLWNSAVTAALLVPPDSD